MLFAALALSAVAARPSLRNRPSRAEIEKMDWVPAYKAQVSRLRSSVNLTDMAVPCAVCGIVVNEVEGFLLENRSDTEIMDIIDKNLCGVLPEPAATGCKTVVGDIPAAIKLIEGKYTVSAVCTELKYCDAPFPFVNDPMPIPTYTINLDLPAEQRFAQVCSIPLYKSVAQYLYTTLQALVGEAGVELEYFGRALNSFYFPPTYAAEIRGCADAFGVPMGWVSVIQLAYELSDACTSIVAKLPNGMIVHGRNLDFWAGMGFTDSLKNMSYIANFQRSGRTVYTTSQIAGYVGVLSGMVPGAFSVTVDTRFYPEGIWELFYEIVAAIEERDASLVTFLVRDSLEQASTYASAVSLLSNKELIADVYYTVAGVSGDQGAVIARNRTAARYTWPLDAASGKWFTGVSNYDVTSPQPWFDDRWDPAVEAMNAAGPAGFTVGTMYNVMSAKPVLNLQSTYTILAVPANSTWQSWTRWCPYPCVQ